MVIQAARLSETRKSSTRFADLMLHARALYTRPRSLKTYQEIENLYRQALALEPDNPTAMAGLAHTLVVQPNNFRQQMDKSVREKKYEEGRAFALKAKELDPGNPEVYNAIGLYASDHGDFAEARRAFETWVSLEPKTPNAYNNLGNLLVRAGEPERGIEVLTQGINLNPKHPYDLILFNMGRAYFMIGDNDAAIAWCLKSSEKNPTYPPPIAYRAMAYALKGEDAKARAAAAELRRVDPSFTLPAWREVAASNSPAYREWFETKLVPAWRKAGLPE